VKRRRPDLPTLLDDLERLHGKPRRLPPRSALDWVLWENAAYLVPDDRSRAAYAALKERTGLTPGGILGLPREDLSEIARLGGMLPERRFEKLLSIAETVQERFDGDLEAARRLPLAKARRAMKAFPGIGDPGADKILLFTQTHPLPALESNGVRVLVRRGLAEEAKGYAATYRSAVAALAPYADEGCAWLMRAHDLLRAHGQALCKHNEPLCEACPLAEACPSAS
jgi:endonuclease-3